jgi:hypothetical protein
MSQHSVVKTHRFLVAPSNEEGGHVCLETAPPQTRAAASRADQAHRDAARPVNHRHTGLAVRPGKPSTLSRHLYGIPCKDDDHRHCPESTPRATSPRHDAIQFESSLVTDAHDALSILSAGTQLPPAICVTDICHQKKHFAERLGKRNPDETARAFLCLIIPNNFTRSRIYLIVVGGVLRYKTEPCNCRP